MERKIGEIFEDRGCWYQCIRNITCINCGFNNKGCLADKHITGDCSGRLDGASVVFKKLEKVGDPYLAHDHSRNKDVVVQDYKLYNQHACYNGHEEMLSFGFRGRNEIVTIKSKEPIKSLNCENSVEIQIEQNKEDMEDNKKQTSLNSTKGIYEKFKGKTVQCLVNNKDGDLVNGYGIVCGYRDKYLIIGFTNEYEGCIKSFTDNVFLENRDFLSYRFWNISHVDDKPFIKPFNLEAARSGKPVCTRDGRKVRIICFDRINGDYYKIVACVTAFDGDFEEVLFYGIDGYIVDSQNPKDEDLMMLPEKKEGWINICRNLNTNKTELDTKDIYNTKEEALQNLSSMTYVTTVKIEWEE